MADPVRDAWIRYMHRATKGGTSCLALTEPEAQLALFRAGAEWMGDQAVAIVGNGLPVKQRAIRALTAREGEGGGE